MRMQKPTARRRWRMSENVQSLIAALLLLAIVLSFLSSCGSDDLIFPGQAAPTPTSQFTATPNPNENN